MQLLIRKEAVHKFISQIKLTKCRMEAYKHVNSRRSLIHKFISHRIEAKDSFKAYELTNKLALKKKTIKFLLLNRIISYFTQSHRPGLSG